MRAVRKIEYVIVQESDVSEELIYAFGKKDDITVLVRKSNKFYWKSLCATNIVWYDEYKTIEQAIDGVFNVKEYKEGGYSEINEFEDLKEFLKWSLNIVK